MQAIHNDSEFGAELRQLFQRAKIQDKCKQFTTLMFKTNCKMKLFQRAKIQDKCKQFTTANQSPACHE